MLLLKFGSRGNDVRSIQEDLNALYPLDYPQLKLDGVFGPNTSDWVKKFQRSNGLKIDGIIGPNTMGKLRAKRPFKYATAPTENGKESGRPTTAATAADKIKPPDGYELLGVVYFAKGTTNIIKPETIQAIAKKASPRVKNRYYIEFGPIQFFVTGLASKEGSETFNKDLAEKRMVFAAQALYKVFTNGYSFKPQSFEIGGEGRGIGTANESEYEKDRRAAIFIKKKEYIKLNQPLTKMEKLTPRGIVEDRLAVGDPQMIAAYDFISVNEAFMNYYKALDIPSPQSIVSSVDWGGFLKGRFGDDMAIHTNDKFYKRVLVEYVKQREARGMPPLPEDLTKRPK